MKTFIYPITAASLLLTSFNAEAIFPVFDASAFIQLVQQVQEMEKQYETLQQTYQNAQQQLSKQEEIAQDVEGHYGYGDLLNSAQDLTNREWSPDTWEDALQGLSGGNPDRYKELLAEYQKNYPSLSVSDYTKGASAGLATQYQQAVESNQASSVNATYAFNNIKQHLEDVNQLSQQIEQTKDTKAAMDLNTRVQSEMAYISIQELKMQAMLNQQLADQGAQNIAEKTSAAQFGTLPEEK